MKILTRSVETLTNDNFTYELDSSTMTAKVTGYNGSEENVVIPEKVEYNGTDYAVTAIGNKAFYQNKTITSVTGDSIKKIDQGDQGEYSGAFYYCKKLETVTLPNATTIGGYAFNSCYKLTTVTLPKTTSIGNDAFAHCTSLTTVTLPKATSIGNYAFWDCTSLTTVTLPNATFIGEYAFASCSALATVTLPNATSIGNMAFAYCTSLTTVTLPQDDFVYKLNLADKENRKAKIMEYKGNENEVTIPEKVTFSNMDVINGEYTLETDNITGDFEFSFGDNATVTKYNGNEEYVTIPEKALKKTSETTATVHAVTAIGNRAFYENTNIKSVTGNSIEKIPGVASVTAASMMRGTKKYKKQELSQRLEENGIIIT